ncbi:MAG: SpoIIE family protein phosphatase [Acidobacteriota bacterium]|nr:SpoIIE family protein phosphatase [Acidobacteriota bacterium]
MVEKQPLQQAILAILLFWALGAQLTYSGFRVYLQANSANYAQVPFNTGPFSTVISGIPDAYRNAGLKPGDNLVALDGKPIVGEVQLDQRFSSHSGRALTVTVDRQVGGRSERLNIPIELKQRPTQWTQVLVLSVFLPLSCLMVGFYIAFARPRDPLAWITLAMLASFGQVVGSGVAWILPSPWRELQFTYHAILSNSWPLWLVLFALYFPVPFALWKRLSWLNWVLAFPSIVLAAVDIYVYLRAGTHLRELHWVTGYVRATEPIVSAVFTGYITAFFVLLGFKQGILKSPDAKRRLKVMSWGCSLALVPLLPIIFLHPPEWLTTILLLMVVFFPITMAYVIVVQRAMEVRMVVRSGVRYAFATNGIKVLRVVLIIALVLVTIELEQQSSHRLEGILIAIAGVLLIVSVGKLAQRLSRWMDRRFFREAYNAELILTDLSNSAAGIRDVRTLLQTVTQRISASMHVECIAVLLERGLRYEPAYALGFGETVPSITLPRDCATVRMLKQARSPSRIYFDDPQSWVHGAPDTEQRALRILGTQLLLPMTLNSRLLGLISLGGKKSEAPYSQNDLHLLGAVASQTGLALENAELTETIRKEIAQRERLDRELEIARDVQQHLFPQTLPSVEGLDFAGYCRPAESVGGDYYDFVRLTNGCLGIAVGDVSGKGIAAALMMASLQASLRGQTIKPCATLAEMVQNINRLVYDASAENRYATFFYAEYDPGCRLLKYVNAGHNSPVVLRRTSDSGQVFRLTEGGTVIGLFPEFPFHQAEIPLESGDLLLAFTDGISEAMNNEDEEFDESRLIQTLRELKARTAADLISGILERVDRFTSGARQHDDMTLVVVRVK